jgi:type VI secretion system protein ImpH
MVALFATPMIAWEVRLHLAPPCIERLRLSAVKSPRKLGWNSFLTSTAGVAPQAHVSSMLRLNRASVICVKS